MSYNRTGTRKRGERLGDSRRTRTIGRGDSGPGSGGLEMRELGRQQRHRRRIDDLIRRIKESADQLASDGPTRGDLKILSRALRELRYAFKVFSPYRRHRKVTVFGSARTRPRSAGLINAGRATSGRRWRPITGWS